MNVLYNLFLKCMYMIFLGLKKFFFLSNYSFCKETFKFLSTRVDRNIADSSEHFKINFSYVMFKYIYRNWLFYSLNELCIINSVLYSHHNFIMSSNTVVQNTQQYNKRKYDNLSNIHTFFIIVLWSIHT